MKRHAAAHNIIALFQNFSLIHHVFPYGPLSLLCNKLSACFDRLERSRDGFEKMISKEVKFLCALKIHGPMSKR